MGRGICHGLLVLAFLALACQRASAQETLVPAGAEWRYLDDGSDQGTDWIMPGFPDDSWKTGAAQLGYGDGDETTEVLFGPSPDNANNDPDNKFITTYFRHTFAADPAGYANALLRVLYDDGVIVYLNGIEVFRRDMPAGAVDHLTTSELTGLGEDEGGDFHGGAIEPALFVPGQNVLAVEIHQVDAISSDISMDLELLANYEPAPPSVGITSLTDGQVVVPDTRNTIMLAADASDQDGTVALVEFFRGSTKLAEDTTAPYEAPWVGATAGQYAVTVVATDNSGLRGTASVDVTVATPRPALIVRGDLWRYDDTGTDLGVAWREPAFDDSSWISAAAELGYGDGDEASVILFGPDAENKHPTYYFRKAFTVTDPTAYESLELSVKADDGYIAYINGVEVARGNLPSGPIRYTTLAPAADEYDFVSTQVSSDVLVVGANTIAVEVHQGEVTSSDVSFDLELVGNPAP